MSIAYSLATLSVLLVVGAGVSCGQGGVSPGDQSDSGIGTFGTSHACTSGTDFTGCPCQIGETRACYTGPATTRDVGTCKDGLQTCGLAGEVDHAFGPCMDEVLPGAPQCDGLDHACNGMSHAACDGGHPPPVDGGGACIASIAPPRLIAPLSTAHATSRMPKLSWELAAQTHGARVQVCLDKACNHVLSTFDASGTSGAPSSALPPGAAFWRVFGMDAGNVGCSPSTVWELFVPAHSAPVNTSWGSVLDINEDGYADAIASGSGVFVPSTAPNSSGTEQVTIYMGSSSGLSSVPALTLTGPNRGFGVYIADAGDVNGDGYADVVVGTWGGETHLFLGGPSGLASSPAVSLAYGEIDTGDGSGGDGHSAEWLAGVGDTNGDGYSDVALGSPYHDKVQVFLGGPSGLATSPAVTLTGSAAGLVAGSDFGLSVATAGDVNGDGYADLLVGASFRQAYVYNGGPSGLQNSPSSIPTAPQNPQAWPGARGAGDVNGDGYTDIVVNGAPVNASMYTSSVFVFQGSSRGVPSSPSTALTLPASMPSFFGWDTSAADFNGDGYWDVVVCAPDIGEVYIYPGGPSGSSTTASPVISNKGESHFGVQVSGGDINADGFDDLGVADWSAMNVYEGAASGVSTSASVTATTGQAESAIHIALGSK